MKMQHIQLTAGTELSRSKRPTRLQKLLASMASALPPDAAFEVEYPGGKERVGRGGVRFVFVVHNQRGASAVASLDEKRIGEAYLDGDISLEGDLVAALDLRTKLIDSHPLAYLWSTYGQRLFFGQSEAGQTVDPAALRLGVRVLPDVSRPGASLLFAWLLKPMMKRSNAPFAGNLTPPSKPVAYSPGGASWTLGQDGARLLSTPASLGST
jgi:hypothetical protein